MPSRNSSFGRSPLTLVLAAMLLASGLSACGRRGALEPPPGAEAPPTIPAPAGAPRPRGRPDTSNRLKVEASPTTLATEPGALVENAPDDDEVAGALTASPLPTPRKRVRGYTVPKDSFFLDPLL